MIIFILISPFLIAIGWVLYIDSSNISKIEEFYEKNSCQQIHNYRSRYKALCGDELIIVDNTFTIDFSTNIVIRYDDIITSKLKEKQISINYKDKEETIYFEKEDLAKNFFSTLNSSGK